LIFLAISRTTIYRNLAIFLDLKKNSGNWKPWKSIHFLCLYIFNVPFWWNIFSRNCIGCFIAKKLHGDNQNYLPTFLVASLTNYSHTQTTSKIWKSRLLPIKVHSHTQTHYLNMGMLLVANKLHAPHSNYL
jgi:hypothetical protein